MSDTFGIRALGQISLNVQDLDRALAFYRDTLAVPFLFQVPKMAFFDLSGVRLMLATPDGAPVGPGTSILYFRVDGIEEAGETLKARGVTFNAEPALVADMGDHELWMAFFKDTENNQLALMEERPKVD